jgi:chorismate synthase
VHLWGESHGPAVGALVEGCPAGVEVDAAFLQAQLDRRRPGQSVVTTQRKEADALLVRSGVHDGKTTGAPLLLEAANADIDSKPYETTKPRPGHADLSARLKFFGFQDPRGGGHFGGRLTFGLTAAGALARLALRRFGVETLAYTEEIGGLRYEHAPAFEDVARVVDAHATRCPDPVLGQKMESLILQARRDGDSVGGVVRCRIRGLPAGLGGYHFESFESEAARLFLGVPAVKGIEFGLGFRLSRMHGSETNDPIGLVEGRPRTLTHRQGGTVGGITDGNEVDFAVAFKPTSSLTRAQATVDLATNQPAEVRTHGRHDPCIVPRAVVVVENAAAIVALDLLLKRLSEVGFQEGRA